MLGRLKTEVQYEMALERVYDLMEADLIDDSLEESELFMLSMLVEAYEKEHYPVPPPHPIEAIRFRLDQMGINESELNRILGYRSRKSEILSGKRKLSLTMIRKLHQVLKIPAETLIAEY